MDEGNPPVHTADSLATDPGDPFPGGADEPALQERVQHAGCQWREEAEREALAVVRDAWSRQMWLLQAFAKAGDELVEEIPLAGFSGEEVRPLLELRDDVPMFDAYPITRAVAEVLRKHLSNPLDLDSFDWFLECDANETTAN